MFMAFLKLHKQGRQSESGFWIEGGKVKIALFGIVPFVLILAALFFTLFPEFNLEMFSYNWPLIVGGCIAVVIGELMVMHVKDGRNLKSTKKEETLNAHNG